MGGQTYDEKIGGTVSLKLLGDRGMVLFDDFVLFNFCVRLDLLLFLDKRVINIYMYVCMYVLKHWELACESVMSKWEYGCSTVV